MADNISGAIGRLSIGAVTTGTNAWLNSGNTVKYIMQSPYSGIVGLAAFEAQRLLNSKAYETIDNVIKIARREAIDKAISLRDKQLDAINKEIISNSKVIIDNYGKLKCSDSDSYFVARDILGRKVETALILSYTGENVLSYSAYGNIFQTKDVFVCDLAPSIEQSSKKNVAVTDVIGRDYSRKEIIGNNDITFRVSGKFVSENMDIYPQDQVSKFIDVARHGGIINVSNLLFGQHNISRIIITDYSLPNPSCLNEQPYSFSCIGVEPNDEVVALDTISPVKYDQVVGSMEGWYSSVLAKYLTTATENAVGTFMGLGQVTNL